MALRGAIRYAVKRREALTRFCYDARLKVDNNRAENCLRQVALGARTSSPGSDKGGERAAAIYTLIESARLNFLDPKPGCATCSPASPKGIQRTASMSWHHGTR